MKTAIIVLAGGRSSRMGGPNKLLEMLRGKTLLMNVIDVALGVNAAPVLVVTGHQREAVLSELSGKPVTLIHNPHYADGLATSLRAGIAALPDDIEAAVILLGDMPDVKASVINTLIAALANAPPCVAAVPVSANEWGNPVVLRRTLFAEIATLQGDSGARKLLMAHRAQVLEVPVNDEAVLTDIDTPEALAKARMRE